MPPPNRGERGFHLLRTQGTAVRDKLLQETDWIEKPRAAAKPRAPKLRKPVPAHVVEVPHLKIPAVLTRADELLADRYKASSSAPAPPPPARTHRHHTPRAPQTDRPARRVRTTTAARAPEAPLTDRPHRRAPHPAHTSDLRSQALDRPVLQANNFFKFHPTTPAVDEQGFLPLESFDDDSHHDRTPAEWAALFSDGGPQGGRSLFFTADGRPEWLPCRVLAFHPDDATFRVEWAHNGKQKSVTRLNVLLDADDEGRFFRRLRVAKKNRKIAENRLRYQLLVDGLDASLIPPMDPAHIDRIAQLTGHPIPPRLLQEVRAHYSHCVAQAELNIKLLNPDERKKLTDNHVSLPDPSFIIPPPAPARATVDIPPTDFRAARAFVYNNAFIVHPVFSRIWTTILASWERFSGLHLFPPNADGLPRPATLQQLDSWQNRNSSRTIALLAKEWVSSFESALVMGLSGDAVADQFDRPQFATQLSSFLRLINLQMADQIRSIIQNSVDHLLATLDSFHLADPSATSSLGLHHPDRSLPEPLLAVTLVSRAGRLVIDPAPDQLVSLFLDVFDNMVTLADQIPPLDLTAVRDLVPTGIDHPPALDPFDLQFAPLRSHTERVLRTHLEGPLSLIPTFGNYSELWTVSPAQFEDDLAKSCHTLDDCLDHVVRHREFLSSIETAIPKEARFSFFIADMVAFCDQLHANAAVLSSKALERVAGLLRAQNQTIEDTSQGILALLRREPESLEQLFEYGEYLDGISDTLKDVDDMVLQAKIHAGALEEFSFPLSDEDFGRTYRSVHWPRILHDATTAARKSRETNLARFANLVRVQRTTLEADMATLAEDIKAFSQRSNIDELEENAYVAKGLREQLDKLQEDVDLVTSRERLLGWPITSFSTLDILRQSFQPYADVWNVAAQFQEMYPQWLEGPFVKLNAAKLQSDVEEWVATLDRCADFFGVASSTAESNTKPVPPSPRAMGLGPASVLVHARQKLLEFFLHVPLIVALRTQGIREHHWEQLATRTGFALKGDLNLTLAEVLGHDFARHIDFVRDLADLASKEYALEKDLEKILADWKNAQFDHVLHKDSQTHVLRQVDDVQLLLDEHAVKIQAIAASPYVARCLPLCQKVESIIKTVQEVLDDWLACQQHWLYLEPIFASDDIMRQLPVEGRRFQIADRCWQLAMDRVVQDPSIFALVKDKEVVDALAEANAEMDHCLRSLGEFLETKRRVFPRFYFLSNDELLDILSKARNFTAVQPHLHKCFEGIHRLEFVEPADDHAPTQIVAMHSASGEQIAFARPVIPRHEGSLVERWLLSVETQMKQAISTSIAKAIQSYQRLPRDQWALKWPGQIVLAVAHTFWTRAVHEALRQAAVANANIPAQGPAPSGPSATDSPGTGAAAAAATSELTPGGEPGDDRSLSDAPSAIVERPPTASSDHDSLIGERALSTVSDPYGSDAFNSQSIGMAPSSLKMVAFRLQTQLDAIIRLVRGELTPLERHILGTLVILDVHGRDVVARLIEDGVASENDFLWTSQLRYQWSSSHSITVRMLSSTMAYGHEYLGTQPRLVITPLTDRCYRTLLGAVEMHMGGAPEGPAGTGKTETTKDLAKALGKQCVVFNCSDGLDHLAMGKFFKGLASSGAWVCFDEFNRIDAEVLSVIAQQILTIQMALAAHRETFVFEGTEIRLDKSCGVFITMNPGYAGRTELPDNLKALFRPVAMMVPDYTMIAEIMLYSLGFLDARSLARKIVLLYRLASEQLSRQDHYDFGMRAIKAVLERAGIIKRLHDETAAEEAVLLQAICDASLPKLLAADTVIFRSVLADMFPGVEPSAVPRPGFSEALVEACEARSVLPAESFLSKCTQLYDTLNVRHGVMLVGGAMAGKTTCTAVLSDALCRLATKDLERPVKHFSLNPKALSIAELYGHLDAVSHEWTDGVLAHLFRYCAQDVSNNRLWIILDGPVDSTWVENMNTVLDDNRRLCLMSGEIIQMNSRMNLLFEVEDLAAASPATVSRCGMIYVEPADLDWALISRSWLQRLPATFLPAHVETVERLFQQHVDQIGTFVRQSCRLMIGVPMSSVFQSLIMTLQCLLAEFGLFEELGDAWAEYTPEERASQELFDSQLLIRLFVFSVAWSFGSVVEPDSRLALDQFLREHMPASMVGPVTAPETAIPADGTVFDYYVHEDSGLWRPWSAAIEDLALPSDVSAYDIVIPTVDTARYSFLLHLYTSHRLPALVVGPSGTGKTVMVLSTLDRLERKKYSVNAVHFSGGTTAAQAQALLEHPIEVRRKNVLGPAPGRVCITFVDDLNMPTQEASSGAQPAIELLRQYLDISAWYDKRSKTLTLIEDVLLIGAMSSGTGRPAPTTRLLRHFNIIGVPRMDHATLLDIFSSLAGHFFARYSAEIVSIVPRIVDATVDVYETVCRDLLPTPAKAHYTYNLRDLAKVFQGMLLATPRCVQSAPDMVALWYHECQRALADRLVDDADTAWFHRVMSDVAEKHLPGDLEEAVGLPHACPVLFGKVLLDRTAQLNRPVINPSTLDDILERQQQEQQRNEQNRNTKGGAGADGAADTQSVPYKRVPVSSPELSDWLQHELESYNADPENSPMDMVLFQSAVEHVMRLQHVLMQPFGHALLLGLGGNGRQLLVRLCAHMLKYNVVRPDTTGTYEFDDWRRDVKRALHVAGELGQPVVLLLLDHQVANDLFLEDVNSLLNNGSIPDLYENDERARIGGSLSSQFAKAQKSVQQRRMQLRAEQLREEEEQRGKSRAGGPGGLAGSGTLSTTQRLHNKQQEERLKQALAQRVRQAPTSPFELFVQRCRLNLHLVLCMSPHESAWRERLRKFPALVNCCTIDWFARWSSDALRSVAENTLAGISIPDDTREAVAEACVAVHQTAHSVSADYVRETRRAVFVTPTSYINFLTGFTRLLASKRKEMHEKRRRFESGLKRVQATEAQVRETQAELQELQPVLVRTQADTAELMARLQTEQEQADAAKRVVQGEESVAEQNAQEAREIEHECETDLEAAMPALEAAVRSLKALNKKDITEVKSLRNPPAGVRMTMAAVCIMMGREPHRVPGPKLGQKVDDYWTPAQKMLGELNFLRSLYVYERDNIPEHIISKIQPYIRNTEFVPDKIKKASKACMSLCMWVRAVEAYYHALRVVEPKRQALSEARQRLAEVEASLASKREELATLEQRVMELVRALTESKARKDELARQVVECKARLERAKDLLGGLSGERTRWAAAARILGQSIENLVGDVLLAAASVVYQSPLSPQPRKKMLAGWQSGLSRIGVPFSADFGLSKAMASPLQIRTWVQVGLPVDRFSTDNAVSVRLSGQFSLMIDPQGQAVRWVRGIEGDRLMTTTVGHPGFVRTVESAVTYGSPLLISKCGETLPKVLDSILLKQWFRKGGRDVIQIGDALVNFNGDFRLYMATNLPNPQFGPALGAKVNIVNFVATPESLEDQLLGVLMELERPELAEDRTRIMRESAANRKELEAIEDEILGIMAASEGEILDDETLIKGLASAKAKSIEIAKRVAEADAFEKSFEEVRTGYKLVAGHGSVAFFCLQDLGNVEYMYQFSQTWFVDLFTRATIESKKAVYLEERIRNLSNHFLHLLHDRVSRSLFEHHKLLFSLLLAVAVKARAGRIRQHELRFLATGGLGLLPGLSEEDPDGMVYVRARSQAMSRQGSRAGDVLAPAQAGTLAATAGGGLAGSRSTMRRASHVRRGSLALSRGAMPVRDDPALPVVDPGLNPCPDVLADSGWRDLCDLSKMRGFEDIHAHFALNQQQWKRYMRSPEAYDDEPPTPYDQLNEFQRLLLLRCLRRDLLMAGLSRYIKMTLGPSFTMTAPFDIKQTYAGSGPMTPILLLLSSGADPLAEIQKYAQVLEEQSGEPLPVQAVSLGQGQGRMAQRLVASASRTGGWVVLQNCHLAASWMGELEKLVQELDAQKTEPSFRLWLTSKPTSEFPLLLLQQCVKASFEAPKGLKSNLERLVKRASTDEALDGTDYANGKSLRRLAFGLCFFHAMILERRNFGPIGWNVPYEFTDSDMDISLAQLRLMMEAKAEFLQRRGRVAAPRGGAGPRITPAGEVPFDALQYVTGEINYGGRITDGMDLRTLRCLLSVFYTPDILKDGYKFSPSGIYAVPLADDTMGDYCEHVNLLPSADTPEVFGLHQNVMMTRAVREADGLLKCLLSVWQGGASGGGGGGSMASSVAREELALGVAEGILATLPEPFDVERMRVELPMAEQEPMNAVLLQEIEKFAVLLQVVRQSLTDVQNAVRGLAVMSEELDATCRALADGLVPETWLRVSYPSIQKLGSYLADLTERVNFFDEWLEARKPPPVIWFGAFFSKHSLLTAVIQKHARRHGVPIDRLYFDYTVVQEPAAEIEEAPDDGCYIAGLFLEGARWDAERKRLTEALPRVPHSPMPVIWLRPCRVRRTVGPMYYPCPVYQTSARAGQLTTTGHSNNYVTTINLACGLNGVRHWIKRGVALLCAV